MYGSKEMRKRGKTLVAGPYLLAQVPVAGNHGVVDQLADLVGVHPLAAPRGRWSEGVSLLRRRAAS